VWVEVSSIKWLIDDENKQLIAKFGLVSGIRFHTVVTDLYSIYTFNRDFAKTEVKLYLDKYMLRDITQSVVNAQIKEEKVEEIPKQSIEVITEDSVSVIPEPIETAHEEDKKAEEKVSEIPKQSMEAITDDSVPVIPELIETVHEEDKKAEEKVSEIPKQSMEAITEDSTPVIPELIETVHEEDKKAEEKTVENQSHLKKSKPCSLKMEQVSEEDMIRGAIESDVPVFLHGLSLQNKSARVKQIDPTCEIIYLLNATLESLNGKSVYNTSTGKMMDVPPTWLVRLEEKCQKEPDRLHVVFFDESMAPINIQRMAFNIILNREVNGIWKLPENARIVVAGDDLKDSLLSNLSAHVDIEMTIESWLEWASEKNIHPAIYSYIAFKEDEKLRSGYDDEDYLNVNLIKWEMASKMLYATGNPEMLRALVGENITREFVEFCNRGDNKLERLTQRGSSRKLKMKP